MCTTVTTYRQQFLISGVPVCASIEAPAGYDFWGAFESGYRAMVDMPSSGRDHVRHAIAEGDKSQRLRGSEMRGLLQKLLA